MELEERRIEIFAPFGDAFDLTKRILFQPFDLAKWCVIGLAAWLATFFSGGTFRYQKNISNDWRWQVNHHGDALRLHDTPAWVIPIVIVCVLFILALIALLLWLNARGRFMFTDCIVRNRGVIAEPWREYRAEANSFFLFQVGIAICSIATFGVVAAAFFFTWSATHYPFPIALLVGLFALWILFVILLSLVTRFMVPVMYRQRCGAAQAFRTVWSLVTARPGVFVLFALFHFLLYIAAAMIGCVAGCVTCCLAILPYVGTVLLLPLVMVLFAFPLCFLRQFGDPYDVWAIVRPAEPPIPPGPAVSEDLPTA